MRKFLVKAVVFCFVILITLVPVYHHLKAGFIDRFYNKFTHKAPSMIVGSSRALLGLDPGVIEKYFPLKEKPMLNFAFTQATSPYGEVYYDAINAKLTSDTDGVFIMEVSPMGIAEGPGVRPENNLILGRLLFFNLDPNIEYMARNNELPLYMDYIAKKKALDAQIPHENGWLENAKERDSLSRVKKITQQYTEYDSLFHTWKMSSYRMEWLGKTVDLLGKHGSVMLVRMPVSDKMRSMENGFCPDFSKRMDSMAMKAGVAFIDLSQSDEYHFDDLHHMTSSSAQLFSRRIADTLLVLWPGNRR